MKELTSINPYSLWSDKGSNKRGMCPFDTAKKSGPDFIGSIFSSIHILLALIFVLFMFFDLVRKLWAEKSKQFKEQYGGSDPARVVSHFQKKFFGIHVGANEMKQFAPTVVSFALTDGGVELFECTGIAVQSGTETNGLTRFLTSAHLVTVFNDKRNREDELRIEVGVPLCGIGPIIGFLELYDDHIAIVTSFFSHPEVTDLDLDAQEICLPTGTAVVALGRPFMFHSSLIQAGKLIEGPNEDDSKDLRMADCAIQESGLGGPLLSSDGTYFVGMNIRCVGRKTWFLPDMVIRKRLEQFQILIPREEVEDSGQEETDDTNPHGEGTSSGTTEISSLAYSPPPGAKRIVPSGFMRMVRWLESMGYPMPPPLMLELNGRLLYTFEDFFGYLHAWKGYPFNISCIGEGANPWIRLGSNIIQNLSRRVVSLASFNGATRFFACT